MAKAKFAAYIIAGCFLCLACLGCSTTDTNGSPVTPARTPLLNPGHTLLGLFELQIDSANFTVDLIAKRIAANHFNVIPFLINPDICPMMNCIQVQLISIDPVTNIHTINVTLRNPMQLYGHDVRGIVFLNTSHQHELVNFDAYTTVFGSGQFNPFIAFAKEEMVRLFALQAVHSAEYLLWIPPQPNPYAIDYAVDVSWPQNCKEPYDITEQEQVGSITNKPGSECILRCRVEDWQDPTAMDSVVVDGESISGLAQLMTYNSMFSKWECTLVSQMNPAPGDYLLPVVAKAADCVYQTKDFIPVTVEEAGPSGNTVTGTVNAYMGGGPMPDIFCFTTDGEMVYWDLSDTDGQYELTDVPNGGRVISFTGIGTLAQFHQIYLTGTGAVVDAEMPLVFLYVDGPPVLTLNPPEVDEPNMQAVISGTAEKLQDNNKVVLIVDGEETLYETAEQDTFKVTVPLHIGMNKIRVRACNAKGYVFSDWIEIDI